LKFHILAIKIVSIDFSRDEGYLTLEFNPLLHDFLYNIICTEIMAVKGF